MSQHFPALCCLFCCLRAERPSLSRPHDVVWNIPVWWQSKHKMSINCLQKICLILKQWLNDHLRTRWLFNVWCKLKNCFVLIYFKCKYCISIIHKFKFTFYLKYKKNICEFYLFMAVSFLFFTSRKVVFQRREWSEMTALLSRPCSVHVMVTHCTKELPQDCQRKEHRVTAAIPWKCT